MYANLPKVYSSMHGYELTVTILPDILLHTCTIVFRHHLVYIPERVANIYTVLPCTMQFKLGTYMYMDSNLSFFTCGLPLFASTCLLFSLSPSPSPIPHLLSPPPFLPPGRLWWYVQPRWQEFHRTQ